MKKIVLLLCTFLGGAAALRAQAIRPLPDDIYQDIPFEMQAVALPTFPDYRVSIVDFGATAGAGTLNTQAIDAAIRHVNGKGGGTVVIPAGLWITGPIELRSNVRLHTEANAFVLFTDDHTQYPLLPNDNSMDNRKIHATSPIYANGAHDIAITGKGVFDGNGSTWRMVRRGKLTESQWKQLVASGGVLSSDGDTWYPNAAAATEEGEGRPNMVRLFECKRVVLQDAVFRNSPAWCIHPLHCEDLVIQGVSVINPWYAQNGDALDVESCDRVIVCGCSFDAGDDAICIKSGKDAAGRRRGWPCQNVVARDNTVYHGHGGFVVGSEMSGDVRNVVIDRCTFIGTDVGLRFKSTRGRGGTVENIFCRRINMFDIANENILFDLYYATKEADSPRPAAVDEGTPVFRNIHISDITGIGGKKAVYFNGLPEMPIQDIELRNISLADTDKGVIIRQAENVVLENVAVAPRDQRPYVLQNVKNVRLNGRTIPAVEKSKTFER